MPDQSSAATEHAILREIIGPLERLPDDPLAALSANFPVGLRGYDREAVDDYVARTSRLVAELQATRSPESAVRRALERVGEQISGILQRAHETAEQITAQSRSEAEDRLEEARREGTQITTAAEQRVRDLDADADRIWIERQRIVGDAEDLSAQLRELARDAARRFEAPASGNDAEPAAGPEQGERPEGDVDGESPGPDAEGEWPGSEVEGEWPGSEVEGEASETDAGRGQADPAAEEDRRDDGPADEPDPGIERTVAFSPLPTRADETQVPDDVDEEPPNAPRRGAGSEDGPGARDPEDEPSTAIIPPASQAASRRLRHR